MSNEIKATSFRLIEDDIQKFREIAEQQGLNQAEMFQSLMNSFQMAKAKGQITDRAKEIEVFQDTVNNIVSMFINSLAINQSSEERIRETLSLELNTKDKTIADLQEHKEKINDEAKVNNENLKELNKIVSDLSCSIEKYTKELEQKNIIVKNQQEQINTLNSIITEYKSYKYINIELESESKILNDRIVDITHSNTDLKDKIENIESMKEFYKLEVDSLKAEVKELNKSIKNIEKSNKDDVNNIYKAHKEELNNQGIEYKEMILKSNRELTERFKEAFNNKIELEKSKNQLELDKAINKEKLIEEKYNNLKLELENIKSKNNKKEV